MEQWKNRMAGVLAILALLAQGPAQASDFTIGPVRSAPFFRPGSLDITEVRFGPHRSNYCTYRRALCWRSTFAQG